MGSSSLVSRADFALICLWADRVFEHMKGDPDRDFEHAIVRRGQPFHLRDSSHVAVEALCSCGAPLTLVVDADEAKDLGLDVQP
jgi:hypothetical protein